MNLEQLKLILDALGTAGEGAFTVFVIWMIVDVLRDVIVGGILITVAMVGAKLVRYAVSVNHIGVKVANMLGHEELNYRSDREHVFTRLSELLELERTSKKKK